MYRQSAPARIDGIAHVHPLRSDQSIVHRSIPAGILFKKKMHPGFALRLGRYPKGRVFSSGLDTCGFRRRNGEYAPAFCGHAYLCPDTQYVFSTVTPTGNRIAVILARKQDAVTYLPLDLSWIVNSVLDRISPACLSSPKRSSGRIFSAPPSQESPGHYRQRPDIGSIGRRIRRVRWLLAPFCERLLCCACRRRQMRSGSSRSEQTPPSVKVTGNMKFDQRAGVSLAHIGRLRNSWAFSRTRNLW